MSYLDELREKFNEFMDRMDDEHFNTGSSRD